MDEPQFTFWPIAHRHVFLSSLAHSAVETQKNGLIREYTYGKYRFGLRIKQHRSTVQSFVVLVDGNLDYA